MNPIVERDIAHVGMVMRASIMSCAPQIALVDYWRRRVTSLMKEKHLAELQVCALQRLLSELAEIEKELNVMRADRLPKAPA
ncbi:hypothetical protein [Paraburkholderia bryophila]|uniref:Uncharacterized protein n=1 Tax=Paraburkholderia bryophila TaxID=420952 RepID=A0A329CEG3_9BURK|nr:hypothetical protein [Paraburkholderia bryophila]RAS33173.1 hypothetical protein BX591_10790 [Paraburkholderia bryophila]